MRWKAKKELYEGDVRYVDKFLFVPLRIGDEYRWLERVTIRQQVVSDMRVQKFGNYYYVLKWKTTDFCDPNYSC